MSVRSWFARMFELRDLCFVRELPYPGKVNDQERSWKGGRNFPKSSDSGGDGKSSYGYEGRNLGQEEEEVFAESYDTEAGDKDRQSGLIGPIFSKPVEVDPTKYLGHSGCPNKWNPNHECVLFCRQFWGAGIKEPVNQEYIKAHAKMIERFYPLPDGWREMYDSGLGRHYYWDTRTDKVSWLPPGHPKSVLLEPASKMRELLALRPKRAEDDADNMDLDSDNGSDEEEDRRIEEQRRKEKERRREEAERVTSKLDRASKHKRKGRHQEEDALDPMDPAAYSDVPRGGWSEGLPTGGDAKTVILVLMTFKMSNIACSQVVTISPLIVFALGPFLPMWVLYTISRGWTRQLQAPCSNRDPL